MALVTCAKGGVIIDSLNLNILSIWKAAHRLNILAVLYNEEKSLDIP
jgi:hypothetical protein